MIVLLEISAEQRPIVGGYFALKEILMTKKDRLFIENLFLDYQDHMGSRFDSLTDLFTALEEMNKRLEQSISSLEDQFTQQHNKILEMQTHIENAENQISIQSNKILELCSSTETHDTKLSQQIENVKREIILTKRSSKEAVWGEIFRDSIVNSKWLIDKRFYPGRWAVGYQYLYVLYRVLNSVKPQSILELGLGQSTCMIAQYANAYKKITHRVVEHDPDWISFFQDEFSVIGNTHLINMDIEQTFFQDEYNLFHYKNFKQRVGDIKYDFISVDAPFGATENEYSRVDILEIIPECLASSFVIMIDDVNRKGEQNTIKLIEKQLNAGNISFSSGKYTGDKDTYIIASQDNKFTCTL